MGSLSQDTGLDCFTSWYLFPSVVDKLAIVKITTPHSYPALVTLETLGTPSSQLSGVPGGQPALICLGIWPLEGCQASTCSGIRQSVGPRRSACLILPRDPLLGRLICLNLPRDSISRRLSCLNLPGNLHPDPGMTGSQVATVLGRISFRKAHP